MRYVGGKSRIAKHLAGIILDAGRERSTYIEPFLGGAAVAAEVAPSFDRSILADAVPDIALMWSAARDGWTPPDEVTLEEYAALRAAEPSPLRGFVGFGCSFGGKWFGGLSKGTKGDGAATSSRVVARQAAKLEGADVRCADYRELTPDVGPDCIIYCDPPYAGTTGYGAAGDWDAEEFWATAEAWAESGAVVLVSEYAAPAGWVPVWEKPQRRQLQGGADRLFAVERLFMWGGAPALAMAA
jgi:DNA adenine methylase